MGLGITEGATASAISEQEVRSFPVTGGFSADITLGLDEGVEPSEGVVPTDPDPEPTPDPDPTPDPRDAAALELYAIGISAMDQAIKGDEAAELKVDIKVPATPIKLPAEQLQGVSRR